MNLGQTASNAEYISLKFELLEDVYLSDNRTQKTENFI
jgi:hypothetical protein